MDEHQFSDAPPIIWDVVQSLGFTAFLKLQKMATYCGPLGKYAHWWWDLERDRDYALFQ